ncbi:MAG: L-histidine N(alpha)-methyltransferase [bacterium]
MSAYDPYRDLRRDVIEGLTAPRKRLPPKYFYDARGSELFVAITGLEEYYQTRTERSLLARIAEEVLETTGARSIVELGAGSSSKTRMLLETGRRQGRLEMFVPLDVSERILEETADELRRSYPGLEVEWQLHDFTEHLDVLPGVPPHLLVFLGSTIGNLRPAEAAEFLADVTGALGDEDHFLMGIDLVKDPEVLEAAYNDSRGVTAEFNKNVLRVLNRELDGDFDLDAFRHRAVWEPEEQRVEMHLVSTRDQSVRLEGIDLEVSFEEGEHILTEISRKFTRAGVEEMLARAGLETVRWYTDPKDWFALSLSRPAGG